MSVFRISGFRFVWLAAYDESGRKLYGDTAAPSSVSDTKYFSLMTQTGNITIGEPYYDGNMLQLCVGAPLKRDGEVGGFLIGSYKYDISQRCLKPSGIGRYRKRLHY